MVEGVDGIYGAVGCRVSVITGFGMLCLRHSVQILGWQRSIFSGLGFIGSGSLGRKLQNFVEIWVHTRNPEPH